MTDHLRALDAAAELKRMASKGDWRLADPAEYPWSLDPVGAIGDPTITIIIGRGYGVLSAPRECAASLENDWPYMIASANIDHAAVAASLRAKDAEIERLREALRNIADVPACSPDGQLYYEIASEDGQTGVMPVDPIGWIQDAANKARAALTPARSRP